MAVSGKQSSRFAFVYMSYSPYDVIPRKFLALPIYSFKLPAQVGMTDNMDVSAARRSVQLLYMGQQLSQI